MTLAHLLPLRVVEESSGVVTITGDSGAVLAVVSLSDQRGDRVLIAREIVRRVNLFPDLFLHVDSLVKGMDQLCGRLGVDALDTDSGLELARTLLRLMCEGRK